MLRRSRWLSTVPEIKKNKQQRYWCNLNSTCIHALCGLIISLHICCFTRTTWLHQGLDCYTQGINMRYRVGTCFIWFVDFFREIGRRVLGHCKTRNRMAASQLGQLNFTPDNRIHMLLQSAARMILNTRQVLKNKLFTGKFIIFWMLIRDPVTFSSKG